MRGQKQAESVATSVGGRISIKAIGHVCQQSKRQEEKKTTKRIISSLQDAFDAGWFEEI